MVGECLQQMVFLEDMVHGTHGDGKVARGRRGGMFRSDCGVSYVKRGDGKSLRVRLSSNHSRDVTSVYRPVQARIVRLESR